MNKAGWFNSGRFRLAALVVLAMAVRVFYLLRNENMPGYAVKNVLQVLSIIDQPGFKQNFNGICSMLYIYLLVPFVYVWRDPVWVPKLVTLIFGVFLLLPYYGTIRVLFNPWVAFFSCCILVFYPLHIVQSSMTTSDAVYYFFIFSSFYYFFSYVTQKVQLSALYLSVLFLNIAALLRFESWVFIPFFFLILWGKEKKLAAYFLVLSMIAPLTWLFLNQMLSGFLFYTFFYSAQTSFAEIVAKSVPYDPGFWSWLAVLWRSSGPVLLITGVLGVLLALWLRQKLLLAVFFMVAFLSLSINSYLARMWHNERYSIFLGLILIPYAVFFVYKIAEISSVRRKYLFLMFLGLPLMNFVQIAYSPVSSMWCMNSVSTDDIKDLAGWLKMHLSAGKSIILDSDPYAVYSQSILLKSGVSVGRCAFVDAMFFKKGFFANQKSFGMYLLSARPTLLILNSKGPLQKVLNFDLSKKMVVFSGVMFDRVFDKNLGGHGEYVVYRVSF